MDALQALAVFYSYVPWAMGAWGALSLLVRRGTRELSFMLYTGVTLVLAELILKNVLHMPRPELSCNTTCGMPSSHATLAVGFLTLRVLDVALRARPRGHVVEAGSRQAHQHEQDQPDPGPDSSAMEQLFSALPVSSAHEHTLMGHTIHLLLWTLLLAPVPWSRLVVKDHKQGQVVMGSVLGFCVAVLWWGASFAVQRKYNHRLGCPALTWRSRTILLHDHALPCYMAITRCTAGAAHDAEAGEPPATCSPSPAEELSWYAAQAGRREREVRRRCGSHGCDASRSSAEVEFCRSRAAELRELARLAKERRPASAPQACRTGEAEVPPGQPLLNDRPPRHARPPEAAPDEGRSHVAEQFLTLRGGGVEASHPSFEVQSFEIEKRHKEDHFFKDTGSHTKVLRTSSNSTPDVPEDHSFHEVESLPSRTGSAYGAQ